MAARQRSPEQLYQVTSGIAFGGKPLRSYLVRQRPESISALRALYVRKMGQASILLVETGCILLSFKVVGPLKVHFSKNVGGRTIRDVDINSFWDSHTKYKKRRGCYVFSMRTGGGLKPGYVGKTKKNFKQEVFGAHQLTRYYEFMASYKKGRPVFFFVLADQAMGKPNDSKIRAVEKYLIDLGLTANPDLLNKRDTKPPGWGIQGVIRGGKGKVSAGTSSFRQMLGIKK